MVNQFRILPQVGIITNYNNDVAVLANRYLPLTGQKVLCIGLSEQEIDGLVAPFGPGEITSLTLWANHVDAETKRYRLVIGDITKITEFPDDYFDAVVTVSLLEHVNPLRAALSEMRRITRRGGVIASIFGPVWSCAYGHHLYMGSPNDPFLNFSLWEMPAFMHLLWSRAEFRAFYSSKGYSSEYIDKALSFIFEWDGINRNVIVDPQSNRDQTCLKVLFYNRFLACLLDSEARETKLRPNIGKKSFSCFFNGLGSQSSPAQSGEVPFMQAATCSPP